MGFCHRPFARAAGSALSHVRNILPGLPAAGFSALLAACSSGLSGVGSLSAPVASYTSSNVFSPAGYNQSKIDDTHYNVGAIGTEATPKDRIEKIARARAAQIGVEEKMKYYKVTNVQYGLKCEKARPGYKSDATPAASRPTVMLAVEYSKVPSDPGFLSSSDSFASLNSEIANEVVAPEQKAVATQETRAACGQQG